MSYRLNPLIICQCFFQALFARAFFTSSEEDTSTQVESKTNQEPVSLEVRLNRVTQHTLYTDHALLPTFYSVHVRNLCSSRNEEGKIA